MAGVDRDVAKRLAAIADGTPWEMADLLVEEFPPEEWGEAGSSRRSGLHAALASYEVFIRDEYGVELKASTMRERRTTAMAWPRDRRQSRASFESHRWLRGEDRYDRMQRYLDHNAGRGLSVKDVRRMRADDKPKQPPTPWEAKVAKRLNSTVKSLLVGAIVPPKGVKPDDWEWWRASAVTDDARNTVARALRELADRITS